jgi:uncharacterized membrane protein YoaK (UPF0700 family)
MNETGGRDTAFGISIGLAFVGGYTDASSYLLARTLSASLYLSSRANGELFIVCMCLALGIQNDALHKTNGISVHSTYMTGMVTTLMRKSFDHLSSK